MEPINFNDRDTIAQLAGLQVKAKEIEKDACAQFMDAWRTEQRQANTGSTWTGD